jgi:hypothetical protein
MPIGTLRWGRKFFVTEDREIGIGPAHLQPNDHICVLFGGRTPYIVRPIEGKPGECVFMGKCYIRKWMDGEAISLLEKGNLSTQWFAFR